MQNGSTLYCSSMWNFTFFTVVKMSKLFRVILWGELSSYSVFVRYLLFMWLRFDFVSVFIERVWTIVWLYRSLIDLSGFYLLLNEGLMWDLVMDLERVFVWGFYMDAISLFLVIIYLTSLESTMSVVSNVHRVFMFYLRGFCLFFTLLITELFITHLFHYFFLSICSSLLF